MGHGTGYISFGIPNGQVAGDNVVDFSEAQAGISVTGYIWLFGRSLASSTVRFNSTDIVDFAGTSLSIAIDTVTKSAVLQSDGSFNFSLEPEDFVTIGNGTPTISITPDYTTAPNFSAVSGGDGIIGAANTTIQAAEANSNNYATNGEFVPLSSPGNISSDFDTDSLGADLFRNAETSPSSVLPSFSVDLPPVVTNVSATTADGTYQEGDTIEITVTFEETVDVTGTPTLELSTGTNNGQATYVSGSGSDTLTFEYIVQNGDTSSDLDYASANALNLAGGSIQDTQNNPAFITLFTPGTDGSLGANKDIVIESPVAPPTAPPVENLLRPTPRADVLRGGAEADRIRGLSEDDMLYGGDNDDFLSGNDGDDGLFGEADNDELRGRRDNDRLEGGDGNDTMYGDRGSDRLICGAGDDFGKGGAGADRIFGNEGNDELIGNGGKDKIFGGDGDDTIVGGFGNDKLTGGDGIDTFVYNALKDGRDKIRDFEIGTDILDLSRLLDRYDINADSAFNNEIQVIQRGSRSLLTVDIDGSDGGRQPVTLAILKGVSASDINADSFAL